MTGLLNYNGATGAKDKVAIFTKNGTIILTADSCKEAILSAVRNGEKTHTADQGQYIRHRVHRDVQSKEVESGGTVLHIDVTK